MAQVGWPQDQAFDALRRASQRENINARDLAAEIVANTTRTAPAQIGFAQPGATRRTPRLKPDRRARVLHLAQVMAASSTKCSMPR